MIMIQNVFRKIVIIIQRIRWIVLYYNEPRKNPFCFISFIVYWFYDWFSLNFLKNAVWKMQRKQILLQPHITKFQFVNDDFANEFCGKLPSAYNIIFPPPTHFWALMSYIKYLHFYTLVFLLYAILPFFAYNWNSHIQHCIISLLFFMWCYTSREKNHLCQQNCIHS